MSEQRDSGRHGPGAGLPGSERPEALSDDQAEDRTVVVPGREPDDRTVVVPRSSGDPIDDRTVVVPHREAEEHTAVVPGPAAPRRRPLISRTETVPTFSGTPAPPVDEPPMQPSPELAALMFKKPLDPKRTVPESPFPRTEQSLPKRGVRPGIPVLYTARTEQLGVRDAELAEAIARRLGPPPAGAPLPVAPREGLASVGRANRRFRIATLVGFGTAVAVSVAGLWWVWAAAFG